VNLLLVLALEVVPGIALAPERASVSSAPAPEVGVWVPAALPESRASLAEQCCKSKELLDPVKTRSLLSDSICLLGHGFLSLTHRRRSIVYSRDT
jgi:hypothetical protein